ncbi:putative autophagy-related protein 11 isoform X1 [Onthophagus taurus]|uniref:putative autophagy-related protein 11 isoform X1 n=1 Tax=Onthophagus taurus TaxID=166361 RepID=UPI0039BEB33D
MGSSHSTKNDFNQSTIQHLQETLHLNNVLIANLSQETRSLKAKMAQSAEKDSNFSTVLETMHEELLKFKENMTEVTENINKSQSEKEIEKLKRDNTALYSKLKGIDLNYSADSNKISALMMLEAEMNVEKNKLGAKLEDLKGTMEKATIKFVEEMEKAQKDIEMVLGRCKERLELIKEMGINLENSKEMEKIKNILLQQNNGFIKDLMEKSSFLANNIQKPVANQSTLIPTLNHQIKNNLDIEIEKEPLKELNISEKNVEKFPEKQPDDDLKILIFYAEENDDEDVEDKTRSILRKLTKMNLTKIKANRMGKKGDKPRAIIVTLDKVDTLNDIMKSRYTLKETEFKGIKIIKFNKDHKKAPNTAKNELAKKNKAADATNPLLSDESDCEQGEEVKENDEDEKDEDLPYKIILHYVPENDNEYDHVVGILRVLTNRPLRNVGYRRLGLKPKNHVRPLVVSFQNEKYVNDCIKNRCLLKDNGFPKIRVCYYRDDLESQVGG